jgi:hypothetical protein
MVSCTILREAFRGIMCLFTGSRASTSRLIFLGSYVLPARERLGTDSKSMFSVQAGACGIACIIQFSVPR